MVKSMTGYGLGEASNDKYKLKVELKTVNHRYNEVYIRLPRHLNYLEDNLKKLIKANVQRGKIDVYIEFDYIDESSVDVKVDLPLALSYKNALELLVEELDLDDSISLKNILSISDVIKLEKKEINKDSTLIFFEETFKLALNDLNKMKLKEGKALEEDLRKKLEYLIVLLKVISERAPFVAIDYRDKLQERIKVLVDESVDLDEEKLNTEVAYFADKSSIDEEVVRLDSHIKQFYSILEEDGAIGRKLDFLVQEMNREINTIGSKANDIIISSTVVDLKSELEKIREQIQNIE